MSKADGQKIPENQGENTNPGEQKAKDSPKDLKEIVAEFAQKNRTLFCICLAFSIWFYHGMFDWSTNFGASVKSSSETLFVVQVFLTAFTMSRILVFINIIDKILRCPIICDLIFWLGYEDRNRLKWIKNNLNGDYLSKIFDGIISGRCIEAIDFYEWINHGSTQETEKELESQEYSYSFKDFEKEFKENEIMKYGNYKIPLFNLSYLTLRQAIIYQKGFFYQKIWFPKLKDFYKANKKLTIFLAILVLSLLTYAVYCFALRPSKQAEPIERQYITEQLFFSYVNKHFL